MAQRITRKELLKKDEVDEVAAGATDWLEHNWQKLVIGAGVVLVLAAAAAGVVAWSGAQADRAAERLAVAHRTLQEAESGGFPSDDDLAGALEAYEQVIEENTGETQAVARYYRAVVLRRLGRTEDAIAQLQELTGTSVIPITLRGATENLLSDLYVNAGQLDDAIALLSAAAESDQPGLPQDRALLKLGQVYDYQGDTDLAREAWEKVLEDFPQQPAATQARQLLGS